MTKHKAGVMPKENVPWNYSSHKRVHGGRPKEHRRMDALVARSDELDIPMWMMDDEEFEKVFNDANRDCRGRLARK